MILNRTRCKCTSYYPILVKYSFSTSENMKGLALQIYFSFYSSEVSQQVGLTTSPINILYVASLWKTMLSRWLSLIALRPPSSSLATSSFQYFPRSACHCLERPILINYSSWSTCRVLLSIKPLGSKPATLFQSSTSPAISCICSTQHRAILALFSPVQPGFGW